MSGKFFNTHLSKYLIFSWFGASVIAFLVIFAVFFKIYNSVVLHTYLELNTIAQQSAFEIQTYVKLLHSAENSLKDSVEANFYLNKIDDVAKNYVVSDSNIYAVVVLSVDKQTIASYPKNLAYALINHAVCNRNKINISSAFYANGIFMVSDCIPFSKVYVIAGRVPVLMLVKHLINTQYKSLNVFLLQKNGKLQDSLKKINDYKNYIKLAKGQIGYFKTNSQLVSYAKIPYTGRIIFASVSKKDIYENYLKNILPFLRIFFLSFIVFNVIFLWVSYKLRQFEKLKLLATSFVITINDINALMIDKMSFRALLDKISEKLVENDYIELCIFYFKEKSDMKVKSYRAKKDCLEYFGPEILIQKYCGEDFLELAKKNNAQAFSIIDVSYCKSLSKIYRFCGFRYVGILPIVLNNKVIGSLLVAGKNNLILKSSNIFNIFVKFGKNFANKLKIVQLEKLQALSRNKDKYFAYHDQLTGFANRSYFLERLQQAIAKAHRSNTNIALFSMDLDRFKAVNDTFGHVVGDMLLKGVGLRLKSIVRQEDTLCRFGGDEFLLLTDSFEKKEELEKLASRILNAMKKPFIINGNAVSIGISIGIACTIGNTILTQSDYLKAADDLLYESKNAGRNTYTITQI